MSETPQPRTGRRMPSLTGVRFPAIFLVFVGHVAISVHFADPDAGSAYHRYLGGIGKMGLSFFFLLSGFILSWAARAGDSAPLFWRRRMAKIVPLHWLTFLVAMAVFAGTAVTGKAAVLNFLMLQSWSSDPVIFGSVNAPSWSLTCLVFFYLLFPVLHRAVARIRPQHLWWCAAAVVALVIAVPAVVRAVVTPDPQLAPFAPASSVKAFWIIQICPVTRLLDFFLGIVMARIVRTGRWIGLGPLHCGVLLTAVYFASLDAPREYRLTATTIIPVALFVASLAGADVKGGKTIVSGPSLQWLGNLSYAFILIHWPVMMFFFKVFGEKHLYSVPEAAGVAALDFTVSIVLAWLLTVGVERPIVRRLARPRSQTAGTLTSM
ncbi:acyltransferase [Streptomyces cinnamoneus]|uniref:acyltransferase family protein n=1 Tax=Streptomyces cinnamoneus TaxID=53446 RepID=UPI00343C5E8C